MVANGVCIQYISISKQSFHTAVDAAHEPGKQDLGPVLQDVELCLSEIERKAGSLKPRASGAGRGGPIYCKLKTSYIFPYVNLAAAVRSDARWIRSSLSVIG